MPSWAKATTVKQVDADTYTAHCYDDWCIGSVPNGGYITGLLLSVTSLHFNTTLSAQDQPHTIALHASFLRRTQAGLATFSVKTVKLGRQTSVIHVSMQQDGREEIVAYITNSNVDREEGISFNTGYSMAYPPPPANLVSLERDGQDENWYWKADMPHKNFRQASNRVRFHFPKSDDYKALQGGASGMEKSFKDEWLCFSDHTPFTPTSLGFVVDMFPQIVESFKSQTASPSWYPTLLLNLDIKKQLPPQGVKWLRVRAQVKKISNGRLDLEVLVWDQAGELVALSNHVSFVVDAERNLAGRRKAVL